MNNETRPRYKDITNLRSGKLVAVEIFEYGGPNKETLWKCICECGNEILVATNTLKNFEKKSCGCKTKAQVGGTHGMYGTPTHTSWRTMRERCLKDYHKNYESYKDKEICQEWVDSFESFFNDMGERPEGHTLDRIDNNLGYNKENCRWADVTLQNTNKLPTYKNKHNGMAGVTETKYGFTAKLFYKTKRYYLGTFKTAEEANKAYNAKGKELAGDAWVYKGPRPSSRPPK